MAHQGNDRREKNSERRASSQGKPPPGTVIDRRLGLDQRKNNDPRTNGSPQAPSSKGATRDAAKGSSKEPTKGSAKSRKKSLVPTSNTTDGPESSPTDHGHTGLERKRGRGRRLSEFTKSAEEGEMTTEQFLFLMAIDAFKKGNDRMFPTWTDVLEVIRLLGYRKTMPTELNLPSAEDWLERSDAPANVRPDRWAERFSGPTMKDAIGDESAISQGPKTGPKSEEELTDEALEAFEAAFGEEDETEDFGEDFDSEFEDGFDDEFSEAA